MLTDTAGDIVHSQEGPQLGSGGGEEGAGDGHPSSHRTCPAGCGQGLPRGHPVPTSLEATAKPDGGLISRAGGSPPPEKQGPPGPSLHRWTKGSCSPPTDGDPGVEGHGPPNAASWWGLRQPQSPRDVGLTPTSHAGTSGDSLSSVPADLTLATSQLRREPQSLLAPLPALKQPCNFSGMSLSL